MQAPWTITPEKIDAAIKRIVSVAHPRKVILFGSVVGGKPDTHSDVDILVVTGDEVESSRQESVRIRRALRGITMPMDILVIPEKRLQELADQPGLVYREAVRHGRVVYDASTTAKESRKNNLINSCGAGVLACRARCRPEARTTI